MRDSFADFLREAHAKVDGIPATIRELEDEIGVRLVIADKQDPDGVGFAPWRVAFYVAGDLNNFLALLDDWFVFKARTAAREQPFEVRLLPHILQDVLEISGKHGAQPMQFQETTETVSTRRP